MLVTIEFSYKNCRYKCYVTLQISVKVYMIYTDHAVTIKFNRLLTNMISVIYIISRQFVRHLKIKGNTF
jgi:hypothetical protein